MSSDTRKARPRPKLVELQEQFRKALEPSGEGDSSVFVRANVARAINIGGSGKSKHASSRQTLRVRQRGDEQDVHEEIQRSGAD